jgi:septum formation inhibitor MinC
VSDDTQQVSEEVIQEARQMGWLPKEEFKGRPEAWVDATTYVDKGRHVLPIVSAHNKELQQTVQRVAGQVSSLQIALQAANATIAAIEESAAADVEEQVKAARENLKTELEAASREGNHAAVAEITDKLTQLPEKKEEKKEVPNAQKPPPLAPEMQAWYAANPDFVSDRRRVSLGNAIAAELREKGETSIGPVFMDKVRDEVNKALGITSQHRPGKTDAGNGGGGRKDAQSVNKTYADLPQEAKEACDRAEKRLVGEKRAHKTQASWRASYVKQYFAE